VDLSNDDLRLFWRGTNGKPFSTIETLSEFLKSRGLKLEFATNSGIYDADQKPLGLEIEQNQTLVPVNRKDGIGNFFLKPNGIFGIGRHGAVILETSEFVKQSFHFAAQSGPLLLRHGQLHPAFQKDSPNRLSRSAVGVISPGQIMFVISQTPVTFYELAVLFRDRLNCQDALYLDGVISQMATPELCVGDHPAPFAGMWAVVSPTEQYNLAK
jgi:uncharacterized protein YigE (DUF2233 family)